MSTGTLGEERDGWDGWDAGTLRPDFEASTLAKTKTKTSLARRKKQRAENQPPGTWENKTNSFDERMQKKSIQSIQSSQGTEHPAGRCSSCQCSSPHQDSHQDRLFLAVVLVRPALACRVRCLPWRDDGLLLRLLS